MVKQDVGCVLIEFDFEYFLFFFVEKFINFLIIFCLECQIGLDFIDIFYDDISYS